MEVDKIWILELNVESTPKTNMTTALGSSSSRFNSGDVTEISMFFSKFTPDLLRLAS